MNTIRRRLRKLEDQLGPPVETEFSRELARRLAAGLRRIAEPGGEPAQVRPRENLTAGRPRLQAIGEILASGRERMRSGIK